MSEPKLLIPEGIEFEKQHFTFLERMISPVLPKYAIETHSTITLTRLIERISFSDVLRQIVVLLMDEYVLCILVEQSQGL